MAETNEQLIEGFIKDLQWDLRDSYNSSSCLNGKQREFLKDKLATLLQARLTDTDKALAEAEEEIEMLKKEGLTYALMMDEREGELQTKLEKHRWIPVAERLPKHKYEDEGDYLVCGTNAAWIERWTMLSGDEGDGDNYGWQNNSKVITHWKPNALILPEEQK